MEPRGIWVTKRAKMETRDLCAKTAPDGPATQPRPGLKTLWVVQDERGKAQPLAFILAGYGDVWVALGLARALGAEHAVYGLRPPENCSGMKARELAAEYIERLRDVQPQGPYCLSGYSAGAVMALEMAIQLRAKGETVGLVALFDPLFIRYTRFEHLSYIGLQHACAVVEKILPVKLRIMQILSAMFHDKGLDRHLEALVGYTPGHYPEEIVFYQARWSVCRSPFLVRQWKWFTRARLRLETVPGDHHTFLRPPHVTGLARRLRSALQKVRTTSSP
jgi:thioesterase domain-containing protein